MRNMLGPEELDRKRILFMGRIEKCVARDWRS
jgi:hypothetical protein